MFFKRDVSKILSQFAKFPVVAILGPRQAGKTTVAKKHFTKHRYINLEDPIARVQVTENPKKFLREYENKHGIIIDEFQIFPELLSYIQVESDEKNRPGYFVLTGSQNFLMNQAITQSLAGRVGILTLLPLSLQEQTNSNLLSSLESTIFKGSYPRLHNEGLLPRRVYPGYLQTYVERDVRQLTGVGNLTTFQKFLGLCAARIGQILNISDIATNLGVAQKTVNHWISVLEASYIAFRLQPYFVNFSKRITKRPKLYFYDTGLACFLLGIQTAKQLLDSPYRGNLFESLIISDFYKQYHNLGLRPSLYFWRDQNGRVEVDCLIDRGGILTPIEIKSGKKIVPAFFKQVNEWNAFTKTTPKDNIIVYAGSGTYTKTKGTVVGWKNATNLITQFYT